MTPHSAPAARRFVLGLLVAAAVLLALVLAPLAEALFMAVVLAGVLHPLNRRLAGKLGGRRGPAAAILISALLGLVVVPIVGMAAVVYEEASAGITYVRETIRSDGVQGLFERLPRPLLALGAKISDQLPQTAAGVVDDGKVGKQVTAQTATAASFLGSAVSATGSALFHVAMMLIALYFLLTQGEQLVRWVDRASPLLVRQTEELFAEFKKVSYSVLISSVITAAIQAATALVGYLIASVPHPIFFTAVTFFVAFVPAIGAGAVCVSAALLLFVTGHPWFALFLTIWGVVVVGLVDNVVKPLLIRGDVELDGGLVFFALLGGLAAFGPVGVLIGPLTLALFLALVRMYQRDFARREPPAA